MDFDDTDQLINDAICAITGAQRARDVLYTFAALTNRITVQIVPLTKLGENQRDDIANNVKDSNPAWIDGDTHLKNPKIWDEVRNGDYTHIILSPEQAVNPKFKSILRDPEFHEKIGLFAIDELHIVGEWRDFRPDFTYLHTLRSLLPRWVPWFGYSTVHTVRSIPKTIIYIDSKPRLIAARWSLCKYAQEKCSLSKEFARKVIQRYDADVRDADKNIIFNNLASDSDCRIVLATVSLGMGMDIPDIVRVVQFGLPKSPSLADLWQRFSRAMRNTQKAAEQGYIRGMAVVFAPYWVFSHIGSTDKPVPKTKQPRRRPARQQQAHMPAIASRLREMALVDRDDDDIASQGSQNSNPVSQTSQAIEEAANAQQQEEAIALSSVGLWDFEKRIKWSKNDITAQEKLDLVIRSWLNSGCFRESALDYLQEPSIEDDPDLEYRRPLDKEFCCNGHNCNRTLGRIPPLEPLNKGQEKPTTGSLAAFAMDRLAVWCKEQAQQLVPAEHRHFDVLGEMWMDLRLQYAVACLFLQGPRKKPELPLNDVPSLVQKLPAIREWEHLQSSGPELVAVCTESIATVIEARDAYKKKKSADRAARRRLV
ncbi:hypothetical protein CHGG_10827 [Chaetomium globosum CBS 148.51]|uniref:DNA 3'-5' helicase n=1 Tax=Chaetomium globosum (strain ATCC 6205 / CBS 148.51 / DSM 1962 / NBRC 6347 / NRRL 1970) TaxID=306901 RepID=Q2GMH7_CHAGB|nr:uncharacterized protein CHGG_10827 [Chaetomium globosum CBS 148.51]EAQ83009.1 hypothetical protein CHGG_10827 [Chaetomium globosum CBS 148.51]